MSMFINFFLKRSAEDNRCMNKRVMGRSPENDCLKGCVTENYFSYFSTKKNVVCTQKNRLNETVLLSTQNTC